MSHVDEIQERLNVSTIRPWIAEEDQMSMWVRPADEPEGIIAQVARKTDGEFIAHAPADIEYLLTLVRQQMQTREEIIAETLLSYAELLASPTYTFKMDSAAVMHAQIVHLLRGDSENFDPKKWPTRG